MKNLKKSLVLLLTLAFVPVMVTAKSVRIPHDPQRQIDGVCNGGADVFREANTTESLICTGHCVLCGFIMSTGANTTRMLIRNTGTADSASTLANALDGALALGPVYFQVIDTGANRMWKFPSPIIFDSGGISVYIDASGSGENVSLLYLDLDEN